MIAGPGLGSSFAARTIKWLRWSCRPGRLAELPATTSTCGLRRLDVTARRPGALGRSVGLLGSLRLPAMVVITTAVATGEVTCARAVDVDVLHGRAWIYTRRSLLVQQNYWQLRLVRAWPTGYGQPERHSITLRRRAGCGGGRRGCSTRSSKGGWRIRWSSSAGYM